jgi:hypothetical protein
VDECKPLVGGDGPHPHPHTLTMSAHPTSSDAENPSDDSEAEDPPFPPLPGCQRVHSRHVITEVGRCRLTVSKHVLKAPVVSAFETRTS